MMPALFTSTSIRPNLLIAYSTSSATCFLSATSVTLYTAVPPFCSICFFNTSKRSLRLAASTIFAPKLPNFFAVASPMPLDAPVIITTFPSILFMLIFPYSSIAYCTIIGSSYSAHIDLFSSSFLSCSISSSNNLKSKISKFCFIRSLCILLGITTIPLCT